MEAAVLARLPESAPTRNKGVLMTTQDHQPPPVETKEEQAEKLRRVLSVKDPAPATSDSGATPPKPATR